MSTKIDRKSLMRSTLTQEKRQVADRFAAADAMLNQRPAGLAVAAITTFRAESGPLAGGSKQVLHVALHQVSENPFNARHIYEPDKVTALAASIATQGQLQPAMALRDPAQEGYFRLIDGHYRKKALVSAGKTHIDIMVLDDASDLDQYRLSWIANEQRSAQSALDNAFSWKKLLDNGVVQEAQQIAEMLGIAPSTVTKTLSLLRLPEGALAIIQERPQKFGVAIGYELTQCSKRMDEPALLNLVHRVIDDDLSSRDLEALRGKLEQDTKRKHKEISRQYKIHSDEVQIGVIKEWDSGKISLEVTLSNPEDRVALLENLKSRFLLKEA